MQLCAAENCNNPAGQPSGITDLPIALCDWHAPRLRARNTPTASMRQTYRHDLSRLASWPGFAYVLVFSGDMTGLAKVGQSWDDRTLNNRLAAHRKHYASPFEVVRVYRGGIAVEDYVQNRLLDDLVPFGTEKEIYSYGPALWDVIADLDAAIGTPDLS